MRNWLKTLLIISAFSPTLLTLASVRYFIKGPDVVFYQLISISLLGTLLPFLILKLVNRESEILKIKVKKVKSADRMLLAFIGTYIAPIVMKMVDIDFGITIAIVMIMIAVSWIISSVPSHPIMYMFKYKFYEIESDKGMVYTLISKKEIKSPERISSVKQLSSNMLME